MTFQEEMAAAMADIAEHLGREIVYRQRVEGAVNYSTGVRAHTVTNVTVTAVRSEVFSERVATGDRQGVVLQASYLIRAASLTSGGSPLTPKRGDFIIDDERAFEVVAVNKQGDGAAWAVTARAGG